MACICRRRLADPKIPAIWLSTFSIPYPAGKGSRGRSDITVKVPHGHASASSTKTPLDLRLDPDELVRCTGSGGGSIIAVRFMDEARELLTRQHVEH